MDHTQRRVPLRVTSPAQRAAQRARPVVTVLGALAALVVLALAFLPNGPILSWTMGSTLLALLITGPVAWRLTGSKTPLQGASPILQGTAFASIFMVLGAGARYFSTLLLAPLLGPPEAPTATLLWAAITAIPVATFMAWATSPVKPRP